MIKHIQTIRWLLPTIFLSVFDHFVGLALKGLKITLVDKEYGKIKGVVRIPPLGAY